VEHDKYKVSGIMEKVDDTTLEILELPIRKWTQDYKEMLEEYTTGTDKVPATIKVSSFSSQKNSPYLLVRITKSIILSSLYTSGFRCLKPIFAPPNKRAWKNGSR